MKLFFEVPERVLLDFAKWAIEKDRGMIG